MSAAPETREQLEAVIWRNLPGRGPDAARAVDAILEAADACMQPRNPRDDLEETIVAYLPRASALAVDAISAAAVRYAEWLVIEGRIRGIQAAAEYFRGAA